MSDGLMRFPCPGCNKRMKAPPTAAGQTATCPACSVRFTIPTANVSLPPAADNPPPINPPEAAGPTPSTPAVVWRNPDGSLRTPSVPAPAPQAPTVPLKVEVPKLGVAVETSVSQSAADDCLKQVVTGALVGGAILGTIALIVACPPLAGALATAAGAAASKKQA